MMHGESQIPTRQPAGAYSGSAWPCEPAGKFDDRRLGRQRIVARVQPPQLRYGKLREIEFGLREPSA